MNVSYWNNLKNPSDLLKSNVKSWIYDQGINIGENLTKWNLDMTRRQIWNRWIQQQPLSFNWTCGAIIKNYYDRHLRQNRFGDEAVKMKDSSFNNYAQNL